MDLKTVDLNDLSNVNVQEMLLETCTSKVRYAELVSDAILIRNFAKKEGISIAVQIKRADTKAELCINYGDMQFGGLRDTIIYACDNLIKDIVDNDLI